MAAYPPEPWQLCGDLHAAALLVPLGEALAAPRAPLPPGFRPLRLGRRGVVGVAWVDYRPGGVLEYRELMATLLVRRGLRVIPHVVAIWVDSVASRDGGRALWGIPKELASFTFRGDSVTASDDMGRIAGSRIRRRRAVPGRWPLRFSVAQTLAGAAKVSPVRVTASLALSAMTVDVDPGGPLGFLAGRRPVAAFSLTDFAMSFGRAPLRAGRSTAC